MNVIWKWDSKSILHENCYERYEERSLRFLWKRWFWNENLKSIYIVESNPSKIMAMVRENMNFINTKDVWNAMKSYDEKVHSTKLFFKKHTGAIDCVRMTIGCTKCNVQFFWKFCLVQSIASGWQSIASVQKLKFF